MRTAIITSAALTLLSASAALANPNQAPDAVAAIIEKIGMPQSMVASVTVSEEDLRRDGLEASYYAEFEAEVRTPANTYALVSDEGNYVIVQPVMKQGEIIPVVGNLVGHYRQGFWETQINILDAYAPGGEPFEFFTLRHPVVLNSADEGFEAFLAERKRALELTHELAMQGIEHQAAETTLRREREAEQARVDAEIAAREDEFQRTALRRAEAARMAEREAADAMLMALFSAGATYPSEIHAYNKVASGSLEVSRVAGSLIEANGSYDLGGGQTYSHQVIIQLSEEDGRLAMTMPQLNQFRSSIHTCLVTAAPNIEGGFIDFSSNPGQRSNACSFRVILKGLPTETAEALTGEASSEG